MYVDSPLTSPLLQSYYIVTFLLFHICSVRRCDISFTSRYWTLYQLHWECSTKAKYEGKEREGESEWERNGVSRREKKIMNEMKPLLPLANVSRCCKASIKCELLLSIHFNRNVCVQCASLSSQCILFHPLSIYLSDYSQSGKMKICYYRRAVDALGINHRTV